MSKQKIDQTMTEAQVARAKRKKVDEAMLPPIVPRAKRSKKVAETKVEDTRPAKGKPQERVPKEELVVFAFRLRATERDLIHKAAGAAKASKFVRALMIAASRGDEKTALDIVRAAKEEMATAS